MGSEMEWHAMPLTRERERDWTDSAVGLSSLQKEKSTDTDHHNMQRLSHHVSIPLFFSLPPQTPPPPPTSTNRPSTRSTPSTH
mmetsp:Transcript_30136/g.73239  ORF Transcript_30136/g.73239 Transcript_30136/m.73239 type:complete len:83 (+) Transcript_30136:381-629(+)